MMRAVFWLLAALVATELGLSWLGAGVCSVAFLKSPTPDICPHLIDHLRDVWVELLAAILALLLAAVRQPPPPPGPDE